MTTEHSGKDGGINIDGRLIAPIRSWRVDISITHPVETVCCIDGWNYHGSRSRGQRDATVTCTIQVPAPIIEQFASVCIPGVPTKVRLGPPEYGYQGACVLNSVNFAGYDESLQVWNVNLTLYQAADISAPFDMPPKVGHVISFRDTETDQWHGHYFSPPAVSLAAHPKTARATKPVPKPRPKVTRQIVFDDEE